MTRVAYICADPGVPVFGSKGCSIHVQEVLRRLVRRGWVVELFARRLEGSPPPELAEVRLHRLPQVTEFRTEDREQYLITSNRRLRIAMEEHGPFDLVYERHALWSRSGLQYARDHQIPSVLEVNAPLMEEQRRHRQLFDVDSATQITRQAVTLADVVICVSSAVAQYACSLGAEPQHVHVVPNGVDSSRFERARKVVAERTVRWIANQGIDDGTYVVGFVGTLRPWHGMPCLGRAFRDLHSSHPRARLLVVGDGPARHELLAEMDPRSARATTITGHVPHDEVAAWLAQMDVAVAPYPRDPEFYFSPLKLLEYMAAGLPVLASRLGDIPDLIQHQVSGLLVEPDNPVALASCLRQLHDDPAMRWRLGCCAADRVAMHRGWDDVVDRMLALASASRNSIVTGARSAG